MAVLDTLLAPERVAVVTMEIQRGVVGDLGCIPDLQKAAEAVGLVSNTARLLHAARAAGIRVIHNTAAFREDRAGSFHNVPMVALLLKNPAHMRIGSPEVALVPELGPAPDDLVSERLHGISPFSGTSLDAMLRSEGATTIVAAGVSLNIGILGLAIEAVNLGYDVVVPADCTVGFPVEYGESVLRHSLAHLASITASDAILSAWS